MAWETSCQPSFSLDFRRAPFEEERLTRTDTAGSSGLFVREAVGHAPDEVRLGLDVLGKAALAFPLSSVDEACDAVALLEVVDAVSDLVDGAAKVAPEP